MKKAIVIFLCMTTACNTPKTPQTAEVVIQADKDFSALSQKEGMQKAFLQYMDSNAVMLRINSMPLVGKAVEQHLKTGTDTAFTLTWQPLEGSISASEDLGYTYGTYTFKLKNGDTTASYGTYCTIWKKQNNGNWKFVLDTGNEGLGK